MCVVPDQEVVVLKGVVVAVLAEATAVCAVLAAVAPNGGIFVGLAIVGLLATYAAIGGE